MQNQQLSHPPSAFDFLPYMSPLATFNPRIAVVAVVGKIVVTATHSFLSVYQPPAHAAVTCFVFTVLAIATWKMTPYYRKIVNCIAGATWTTLAVASVPMIVAASIKSDSVIPAVALGVCIIPSAAGAFFLFLYHCRAQERPLVDQSPVDSVEFEKPDDLLFAIRKAMFCKTEAEPAASRAIKLISIAKQAFQMSGLVVFGHAVLLLEVFHDPHAGR